MAGAGPQERHDAPEVVGAPVHVERADRFLAMRHLGQPLGQARQRRHEIGDARRDGVLRHGGKVGLGRLLHHNDAAGFLDGTDARGAIRTGARQDHGDAVTPGGRDGAEEHVDRRSMAARFGKGAGRDAVALDHQFAIRRNDVDAVGPQGRPVVDPQNRHAGADRQDLGQRTGLIGRKVDNDHIGEPKGARKLTQQPLQGRDAARRSANGANGHERLLRHGVEAVVAHKQPPAFEYAAVDGAPHAAVSAKPVTIGSSLVKPPHARPSAADVAKFRHQGSPVLLPLQRTASGDHDMHHLRSVGQQVAMEMDRAVLGSHRSGCLRALQRGWHTIDDRSAEHDDRRDCDQTMV